MKAIKTSLKSIAVLLTALLLFQSCVAYHNKSTLEKASKEQIRTKVTDTNGKTFKYKYITYEDGQFYGVSKKSGEWIKSPLNHKDIEKVFTEDKGANIIGSVILGALALNSALMLLYIADVFK